MKLKTFLIKALSEYCGYVYIVSANDRDQAIDVYKQYDDSGDQFDINELTGVFSEGEPQVIFEKTFIHIKYDK